jgi:cytochrome c oxidase cbb3-type subunit 3
MSNAKDSKNDKNENIIQADEKHLLLDHDYDGIQELNHPLPKWWNLIFYTSCAFGFMYWIYYEFMQGPNLRDELKQEMSSIQKLQEEDKKKNSSFRPELFAHYNKPENKERALQVYMDNCHQCHSDEGKGDIGPNLTDKYWLVTQGNPETNFQIVYTGSEANGMPAWGEVLAIEDIYLALSYVESLKNTNHPQGKAPQGVVIE